MTLATKNTPVNRTYKSRIFEMIFSDKTELLTLYNAVNKTHYTDSEQLEINTLENAIYMSMHNDLSFLIDSRLSLYEHQSTYSPNLPLRYLFYISDLYSVMTRDSNLYGTKKVILPTPKFLIFYNGVQEQPEVQELKLSDVYTVSDQEPSLELKATMLNINPGKNEDLKNACKALKDYAEYTSRIRRYTETMSLPDAVEQVINECIQEGILSEFLSVHRTEAIAMSIYEYDEERHMRQTREEGYDDGLTRGRIEGLELSNLLIRKLAELGRMDDIVKAANDPEYQEKLLLEFDLK